MKLSGKIAVITGAARGVGAAVSRRMAQEGARVLAVDVLKDQVEAHVAELRASGLEATAIAADISTQEGNQEAIGRAMDLYGGLDIFHANAAVIYFADSVATTERIWDQTHAVNLRGAFLGCRAAIPELIKRGGGSLIFTASVLGVVGDAELLAYGAGKGGLRAMCRSLSVAHGPQNIRCNTICPGDIQTTMLMEFLAKDPDPVAALEKLRTAYPLRRLATPDDVANVAIFLASDDAKYITGTDIIVDGGLLAKCY